MIFATQNQIYCFLIFIFFGLIFALIAQFFNVLFLINYQKIFVKIVFDSIFYGFFSIFLVFLLNIFNFGKFTPTLIFACLLGFGWMKKLTQNLVALFENKWYNFIVSQLKRKQNGKKSRLKKG